eukprot:gnl/MRDRNA2_/MRDRNA2_235811_c0_seq1.p1 gnl/MRDRNA2_/MRDRNA2_235811_c0~~gnl/MRDRNA2_/MRDRNA2_235811_c0_seq1.p1  ORF type:complete len:356 (-),score=22.45 gnl/MRDRNA2_/MRDRNA2_235811_c0_seq1:203-1234(-)
MVAKRPSSLVIVDDMHRAIHYWLPPGPRTGLFGNTWLAMRPRHPAIYKPTRHQEVLYWRDGSFGRLQHILRGRLWVPVLRQLFSDGAFRLRVLDEEPSDPQNRPSYENLVGCRATIWTPMVWQGLRSKEDLMALGIPTLVPSKGLLANMITSANPRDLICDHFQKMIGDRKPLMSPWHWGSGHNGICGSQAFVAYHVETAPWYRLPFIIFESAAHLRHLIGELTLEQLQHVSKLMLENTVSMLQDDLRFWKMTASALACSGRMDKSAALQMTFQDPSVNPDPQCLLGMKSTKIPSICCSASCVDCGYCPSGESKDSSCCFTQGATLPSCSTVGAPCELPSRRS